MQNEITPPATETDDRLRQFFDRSFELEMLVSGAVLYLLFSFSSSVSELLTSLPETLPRTPISFVVIVAGVLFRGVLMITASLFVLHLVVRSFWVGVVGLASVFPSGIRADRAQGGPIMKKLLAETPGTLASLQQRIDRFCRLIFSIAFVIILQFTVAAVVILGSAALAYGLQKFLFPKTEFLFLAFGIYSLFFLPALLASLLDYCIGKYKFMQPLGQKPWLVALIRAAFVLQRSLLLQNLFALVYYTIYTNITKTQLWVGAVCIMLLLVYFQWEGLGLFKQNRDLFSPTADHPTYLEADHYENTATNASLFQPTIQSDIITEPYVRLFLPIDFRRADSLLLRYPSLAPQQEITLRMFNTRREVNDSTVRANLLNLRQLFEVRLNDSLIAAPDYSFYTHPQTEVGGLRLYLPAVQLKKGRHVLHIKALYRTPPRQYHIPFYR